MEIIKALEATRDRTLPYFQLPGAQLERSYAAGKWTVRQLLHHIADAETVLYERIRRTIAKPNQVIWGFDQDAWCTGLDYAHRSLELNAQIYPLIRSAIIELAKDHYEPLGHHQFVHSKTGLRSLRDEFDKVAWHNEHHIEQIEKALNF